MLKFNKVNGAVLFVTSMLGFSGSTIVSAVEDVATDVAVVNKNEVDSAKSEGKDSDKKAEEISNTKNTSKNNLTKLKSEAKANVKNKEANNKVDSAVEIKKKAVATGTENFEKLPKKRDAKIETEEKAKNIEQNSGVDSTQNSQNKSNTVSTKKDSAKKSKDGDFGYNISSKEKADYATAYFAEVSQVEPSSSSGSIASSAEFIDKLATVECITSAIKNVVLALSVPAILGCKILNMLKKSA